MKEHINIDELRYPVGKFRWPRHLEPGKLDDRIKGIEEFPAKMAHAVNELSDKELGWKYRPDGWTIRQVVHHCADSHMNAVVRFKLALTEDNPSIVPYLEARWAELADMNLEVQVSLGILNGLHHRWTVLLRSLSEADFKRTYFHSEHKKTLNLYNTLAMYNWHCRHHLAHVYQGLKHKGEFN